MFIKKYEAGDSDDGDGDGDCEVEVEEMNRLLE